MAGVERRTILNSVRLLTTGRRGTAKVLLQSEDAPNGWGRADQWKVPVNPRRHQRLCQGLGLGLGFSLNHTTASRARVAEGADPLLLRLRRHLEGGKSVSRRAARTWRTSSQFTHR